MKNAIIPYILIMAFGIGLIFFLSLEGVGNEAEIGGEHGAEEGGEAAEGEGGEAAEGEGEEASSGDFNAEEVAQQRCASCHGQNYEGSGAFPSLVATELSTEEIAEVIRNGRGSMPPGLVEEGNIEAMAEWVASLE